MSDILLKEKYIFKQWKQSGWDLICNVDNFTLTKYRDKFTLQIDHFYCGNYIKDRTTCFSMFFSSIYRSKKCLRCNKKIPNKLIIIGKLING